jgi:hypothetical protein
MKVWECEIEFSDGFRDVGLVCENDETPEGYDETSFIWYGLNPETHVESEGDEFKILSYRLVNE